MPYQNSYVCRLYNPKDYVKGSFRRTTTKSKKDGRPIGVILARRKGGHTEVQSLRFPASIWKVSEVKTICRDNYGLFEDVRKNPPTASRTRKGKLPQGCVLIYDRLLAIEAVKSNGSNWPKEKFRHDFTRKGSKVYGLPNGDLLIRGKVPLHKEFEYDERETVRGGAK